MSVLPKIFAVRSEAWPSAQASLITLVSTVIVTKKVVLNGKLHAFGQVHLKLHLTTARGGSAANITGSLHSFRKNGHNVDLDAHLWVTEGGKPHGSPDGGVVRHVMAEPLGHRLVNLVSKPPRGTSSPGLDAPSPHQR